MTKQKKFCKRAISPAISTTILIGVAVVGAIAAGNAMFSQNEISQKITRLDLIDASIVRMTDSRMFFEASVRNSGTTVFSYLSISFADDSGVFHAISKQDALNPGEQFAGQIVVEVPITIGNRYLIKVEGTTTTGSSFGSADVTVARG